MTIEQLKVKCATLESDNEKLASYAHALESRLDEYGEILARDAKTINGLIAMNESIVRHAGLPIEAYSRFYQNAKDELCSLFVSEKDTTRKSALRERIDNLIQLEREFGYIVGGPPLAMEQLAKLWIQLKFNQSIKYVHLEKRP